MPGTLSVGALLIRCGPGRCMCMHVQVQQTVNMLGHIAMVGSTVQWVLSQRHTRGINASAGMRCVWALHRAPHSARMAQAPRSLCHRLTHPLLQRDRSVPQKLGRQKDGGGACRCRCQCHPPDATTVCCWTPRGCTAIRGEISSVHAAVGDEKMCVARGVARRVISIRWTAQRPSHVEPWIAHVSGRTQPPLRVMIGFWCVIRLAAITSARPIRRPASCAPRPSSCALSSLCRLALSEAERRSTCRHGCLCGAKVTNSVLPDWGRPPWRPASGMILLRWSSHPSPSRAFASSSK
jgi:hypothetical protein